jgi:hypothetical protein
LSKVERELVASGERHDVECAVEADGGSPALDFLRALERGMWEPDPDSTGLPDDAQLLDYDKFLNWLQHFSDAGEPMQWNSVNYLRYGIWEFKRASKRVSFYDTPGDGTTNPKEKILDRRTCEYPESDYWWLPNFDEYVRLGHSFPKTSQKTEEFDIEEAERIREEDLNHDKG